MKQIKEERKKQRIAKRRTKTTRKREEYNRKQRYIRKEIENAEKRELRAKIGRRSFSILDRIKNKKRGSFLGAMVGMVMRRLLKQPKPELKHKETK